MLCATTAGMYTELCCYYVPSMQISPASPAQLASRTQIQFSGDEHPLKLVQNVHSTHMYRDYADAASKIVLKGQSAAQACCMCKATAHYG